jgi:prepilin-type N-terminal cleavage/methylation domain-containing protein
MNIKSNRKGFTLIELLVVIAIIAVLAVVVILSLNPAELLRQARDSNRVSDMATLKSAISLYLADVSSPNLASTTAATLGYNIVYVSGPVNTGYVASSGMGIATLTNSWATSTVAINRTVDGTGWVPVGFSKISSGAPIGSLPVDPVNSTTSFATVGGGQLMYYYVASSTSLTFKLVAHTESGKFSAGGTGDVETGDGGVTSNAYEQGTSLSL